MMIASWNVNSLRVRLEHVCDWLQNRRPDVLGLQEIKLVTEAFPADAFEALGYHSAVLGQKTYNGVALLSRKPGEDIVCGIPGFDDDQSRVITASYAGIRVVNVYVPNGQSVGSEKFAYKMDWLDALHDYLATEMQAHPELLVMGDFNIAPDDRDVHDPEAWHGKVLCSDEERARLGRLFDLGLKDCFRLFEQPERVYSWWDYRNLAFRRKQGLRIDLILASDRLAGRCTESSVDIEPRRLERPSDHAPVYAVFQ